MYGVLEGSKWPNWSTDQGLTSIFIGSPASIFRSSHLFGHGPLNIGIHLHFQTMGTPLYLDMHLQICECTPHIGEPLNSGVPLF